MFTIDHCLIQKVVVHHVGNSTNGEGLNCSKALQDVSDDTLQALLKRFFLQPFTNPEFYSFTFSNEDFTLNPLFNFCGEIFDKQSVFLKNSAHIAKHLYIESRHPQIKAGDLFVAYFTDILLDGEPVDAIGIFKSENRQPFLKVEQGDDDVKFIQEDGINIDKLDKGCLIFNKDVETGFRICMVDKSNKSVEAQFWKDEFLHLRPLNDNYHHTKQFLDVTRTFVTNQLSDQFEVSKADKIDLLNRSVAYFKKNESFDKAEFEKEVFQDAGVIKAFQNFNEQYSEEHEFDIAEQFDISQQAVKKQARVFKSVLKLDKNFHIYIHGDRELIEHGTEKDGRKFYKIYYKEES